MMRFRRGAVGGGVREFVGRSARGGPAVHHQGEGFNFNLQPHTKFYTTVVISHAPIY